MNEQNLTPFQPGQSGNPKGKPKGTLSAKTIIRKWLKSKEKIIHPITKKEIKVTVLDSITLALIVKARKGDVNAFNALMDRTEGKPVQAIAGIDEHGNTAPLQVVFKQAEGCEPINDG